MLNKRADIQSLVIMVVLLFVIATFGIIFTKAFRESIDELKASPEISQSEKAVSTMEIASEGTKYFDYLFFFLFIAMFMGLIISSMYIPVKPVFVVLFIIGWVICIGLAAMFANVYTEITAQPELAETAASFTFTDNMMPKFPVLIFVAGLIGTIVLFGKARKPESAYV